MGWGGWGSHPSRSGSGSRSTSCRARSARLGSATGAVESSSSFASGRRRWTGGRPPWPQRGRDVGGPSRPRSYMTPSSSGSKPTAYPHTRTLPQPEPTAAISRFLHPCALRFFFFFFWHGTAAISRFLLRCPGPRRRNRVAAWGTASVCHVMLERSMHPEALAER